MDSSQDSEHDQRLRCDVEPELSPADNMGGICGIATSEILGTHLQSEAGLFEALCGGLRLGM